MEQNACALLVLGMHRSGTSALTGLLHVHGVQLGSELLSEASDNQAGFWENRHIVAFHERLLAAIGTSWDDPREMPQGWLEQAQAQGFLDELVALLQKEFGSDALWAVKDPRLCRLLPLWRLALEQLNITPKLVFIVRDPSEVVGSLKRRNGLSAAAASMLWLRYLHESISGAQHWQHCILSYSELLQHWQVSMDKLAASLALTWPVQPQIAAEAAAQFLRKDLQHQRADVTRTLLPETWRPWLLSLYETALAANDEPHLEQLCADLQCALAQFDASRPLLADLRPKSETDGLHQRQQEVEAERDAYRAEASRLFDACEEVHQQMRDAADHWQATVDNLNAAWQAERQVHIAAEQKLSETQMRLVAAQGEIIKRNARLESTQSELELIKNSRSWKLTKPLRFLMRTLRNRGLTEDDRNHLGLAPKRSIALQKSLNAPVALVEGDTQPLVAQYGAAAETVLAAQSPQQRDVFVWAVIDWHFRIQRPQHLARELANEGHRVFYISNNFINRAEPGFSVEPLDAEGRLFQVRLHLAGSPAIYHAVPDAAQCEQLRASVALLLAWARSRSCLSLVQHPYWLETAQVLPNQRLVYDCMDHHAGFADNAADVLTREHELMRKADLLVVTSGWLYEEAGRYNPNRLMVRNACQYEHFCTAPAKVFQDPQHRRVIGYYGAIAEWFDLELVEAVAKQHPDCLVLLVGNDTTGAQRKLKHLNNVQFTGEVPYRELPYYLYAFDVCLLPFHVIPLTLATNPVKVYEYLSAGKEVVAVDLPEMQQFGDLVRVGAGHAAFLAEVSNALQTSKDGSLAAPRRAFAEAQTWAHRVQDLVQGVEAVPQSKVSVVVVTYNNLEFNRACLDSLERLTGYPALEVIVVDNASTDETPALLREWVAQGENRKIILNADNKGFAAANNQGLEVASGDYLVMLNNDTYVTPGWVSGLVRHFQRNPNLGMLGPVTNNIGNEARIEIRYDDMTQMLDAAGSYTARHAGLRTPLRTAAFFCVMMPRRVYEKVGKLDEAFGIGMFEDDDYCRRVQQEGWDIACADDVFIHHHLSASFDQIKLERRKEMFEHNKAIYEAKWGPWVAHQYRGNK